MVQLAISTSPRMTWLWAPDEAAERQVRDVLGDRARLARRAGRSVGLVVDVGIGVDALSACEALAAKGSPSLGMSQCIRSTGLGGLPDCRE